LSFAFVKVGITISQQTKISIQISTINVRDPPALENHVKEIFWQHRYLVSHPVPQYPIREYYRSCPAAVIESFIENAITEGAQNESSVLNVT
jgi:hypothetical protein